MSEAKFHQFDRVYKPNATKYTEIAILFTIILLICIGFSGLITIPALNQLSNYLESSQADPLITGLLPQLLCVVFCVLSLGLIAVFIYMLTRGLSNSYDNKSKKIMEMIAHGKYNHKFTVSNKKIENPYRVRPNANRRNDDQIKYYLYDKDKQYFVDRFMYYSIEEGDTVEVCSNDMGEDGEYVYKLRLFKEKIKEATGVEQYKEEVSAGFETVIKMMATMFLIFIILAFCVGGLAIGEAVLFKTDNIGKILFPKGRTTR